MTERRTAVTAVILGAALSLAAMQSRAGNIDCSLLYDEYDSLMGAGYLQTPMDYVDGYDGWFSQPAFDTLQRGEFSLHPERGETGVIIFRTNHNRHGKLLYYWTDPLVDGRRYLVISEAAWYARVADGAGLEVFGRLRANSDTGIDLDTLALVELPAEKDDDPEGLSVENLDGNDGSRDDAGHPQLGGLEPEIEQTLPDDAQALGDSLALPGGEPSPSELLVNDVEIAPGGEIAVNSDLSPDMADLAVLRDEETGIYVVSAINGAEVFFPTESLCIPGQSE